LNGWEEKAMAVAYPLVRVGDGEAVFEKGGSFRTNRFTYRREGVNELLVITEDRKGDDVSRHEYRYRRVQVVQS
jgi:hypothetical protein